MGRILAGVAIKEAGLTVVERATGFAADLGGMATALDAAWKQALRVS
jgi:hypothetical protein